MDSYDKSYLDIDELAKKIEEREVYVGVKNALKANKHGDLAIYEKNIRYDQQEIEKITRKRAKNFSPKDIEDLRFHLRELQSSRERKAARIKQLTETREKIKRMQKDIDGLAQHIKKLENQK